MSNKISGTKMEEKELTLYKTLIEKNYESQYNRDKKTNS